MNDMDDILREFLVESNENLDQLDRDLVALEKDPTAQQTLAGIFRTMHTLKGTCGFLGYTKLESLAHAAESLLSRLRDGKLVLNPEMTSVLLAAADAVRRILVSIESTGQDGDDDYSALIQAINILQNGETSTPTAAAVAVAPETSPSPPAEPEPVKPDEQLPLGEMLVQSGKAERSQVLLALKKQEEGDPRRVGEILVEQAAVPPPAILDALQEQQVTRSLTASGSSIRIDVGLLDKLMNLVGELVLARNQILQFSANQQDAAFLNTSQRLNLITTELQEGVMKTRMQPIENIWAKFPRVVRDLATACGKQVRIEMQGKETELDKTLIEAIKDPLTHIVRNSVDHGIETPERRLACGKPPEGRLFLRAFHEGGQVNIEIADDGAGIDLQAVKRKALERGLISAEQAARMGDRELLNLIFLPGFSTSEKITKVSGRGVGMDVAKTNIEKIGGTIDIQNRPGQGATLKVKIPLTLAIIPALVVTCAGNRYAIPQVSLLELVRLEGEQARKGIETIHDAPVYRLRGNLLPLVYLNRALAVESPSDRSNGNAAANGTVNIVVLQADEKQFGLVADEINDTEEIVVKPLGNQLKGIGLYAGATIMGDGRVALILDVLGLAQQASMVNGTRDRALADKVAEMQGQPEDRQALLLFRTPGDGRMAIPLSLVSRLEEFERSAIENMGSQLVMQYRGEIMPLVRVADALPERRQSPRNPEVSDSATQDEKVQVVVYSENGRHVGLEVDRILDVVETKLELQRHSSRKGTLGSLVIQGKVTELLDVAEIVQSVDSSNFEQPAMAEVRA